MLISLVFKMLTPNQSLILILVEQEVFLSRIVRPNILYTFIYFTFVLYLLKVLQDLQRRAGTDGIVNQFILGGRPGSVFENYASKKTSK